jgi:hypothetical protein
VDFLLRHSIDADQKAELMCATHNQESIEKAIDAMNKYGVNRKASTISFAQLYGMSDHLSFNLVREWGCKTLLDASMASMSKSYPDFLFFRRESTSIVSTNMFLTARCMR